MAGADNVRTEWVFTAAGILLTLADEEGGNCKSGAAVFSSTNDGFLERDSSDFTRFDTRCFGNAIGCCCCCCSWLLFESWGSTSAFSVLTLTGNVGEDVEVVEVEVDADVCCGSSSTNDFNLFLSTDSSSLTSTDSFNGVVTDGVDDFRFMGVGGSSEIELLLLELSWLSRK